MIFLKEWFLNSIKESNVFKTIYKDMKRTKTIKIWLILCRVWELILEQNLYFECKIKVWFAIDNKNGL